MIAISSPEFELLATFLVSVTVSYALGFLARHLLSYWRILDTPKERSSHSKPVLRGGGLGIVTVILLGAAVISGLKGVTMGWVMAGTTGLLAVVSFLDDRSSQPWWLRLGVQTFAALIMAIGIGWGLATWYAPLLLLVLVGYANAFNFMDGVNGLAAMQATVSAGGMAMIAVIVGVSPVHPAVLLSMLVAGAAAGFLPHNFPRARMFMGDVGSVPLGFLLMLLTAWIARDGGAWLWIPLGALHAGFVFDTSITMLRRALRGEKVHEAHREHFYQRLLRVGWSHPAVTGAQMTISVAVLSMWLAVVMTGRNLLPLAMVATVLVWAGYFAFCEWVFIRQRQ